MKLIRLLCLALIVGCATPYQSQGFKGGLSHTQVAPGAFIINFKGNAFTEREAVGDYALLGAAELTRDAGFKYFTITEAQNLDRTATVVVPGSSTTQGQWVGNQYQSYTHTTPASTYTAQKPGVTLAIQCAHESGSDAFDAAYVISSIRSKYGLR